MASFVALLRAVNVGGTGKLPMSDLKAICEELGFTSVRTYIASGNVVFTSGRSEAQVKADLEARLAAYAGKPVGVLVRSAEELEGVLARNPFADKPGNRTVVLFEDVVEIGRRPAATSTSEFSACFQFGDGAGVCRVAIHIDDSWPDFLAATQRKPQEMLSRDQIAVWRQHEIDRVSF